MEGLSDVTEKRVTKKRTKEEEAEREILLEQIRVQIVRDENIPIKIKDILPEAVLEYTNAELKNVMRNINIYKSHSTSMLNTEGIINGLNRILEYSSDDSFTVETAVNDEALKSDLQELVTSYIGEVPLATRIFMRLLSHVRNKQEQQEPEKEKK